MSQRDIQTRAKRRNLQFHNLHIIWITRDLVLSLGIVVLDLTTTPSAHRVNFSVSHPCRPVTLCGCNCRSSGQRPISAAEQPFTRPRPDVGPQSRRVSGGLPTKGSVRDGSLHTRQSRPDQGPAQGLPLSIASAKYLLLKLNLWLHFLMCRAHSAQICPWKTIFSKH